MRIFVSGGAGFVGAHLCRQALDAGHQVLNYDALTPAASLSEIWDLQENPNYLLIHGNLRDEPALDRAMQDFQPDAVIDLAAHTDVAASILNTRVALDNIHMRDDLLQTSLRYWQGHGGDFRFITLSGCQSNRGAYSPYTVGKTACDGLAMDAYLNHGLPVVFADCATAYGPRQGVTGECAHLILSALNQRGLRISGDDHDVDWIHVGDLARGLLWCTTDGAAGHHYPIKAQSGLPVKMLVRQMCRLLQIKAPQSGVRYSDLVTLSAATPPVMPKMTWQNVPRATPDWHATIEIETGLAQTVDWYITNQSWWKPMWDKLHPNRPAQTSRPAQQKHEAAA